MVSRPETRCRIVMLSPRMLLAVVFMLSAAWAVPSHASEPTEAGAPAAAAVSSDASRRAAARRQRIIIFNNDGGDSRIGLAPETPDGFLSLRMDHIGGCGVDTVFYCTTWSNGCFTHRTKVGEILAHGRRYSYMELNRVPGLIERGTDPLQLAIDSCRKHRLEVFWTHRLNDIHDCWRRETMARWKLDNPHLLMGVPADLDRYPSQDARGIWSFLDYSHREVRDRQVSYVEEVLDGYDVDGVDLDFLRHPCYFRESRLYEPATREHMDSLTEMVGRIRRHVLAASTRKGKPILLSARVFPTLDLNRRFGLDVELWAQRGYVDLLVVGGGYDPFTMPAQDMIDRGHAWGLPVYVCLSASGLARTVESSQLTEQNIAAWRGAAANAWYAGADGIMTFNLFPKLPDTEDTRFARSVWKDISEPTTLGFTDKLYVVENLQKYHDAAYTVRSVPIDRRLPVPVNRGETVQRVLRVADGIPQAANRISKLRLRIGLAGLQPQDTVAVAVNNHGLKVVADKAHWLAADVPPSVMRQGENTIAVTCHDGQGASLTLDGIELSVCYSGRTTSESGPEPAKSPVDGQ